MAYQNEIVSLLHGIPIEYQNQVVSLLYGVPFFSFFLLFELTRQKKKIPFL